MSREHWEDDSDFDDFDVDDVAEDAGEATWTGSRELVVVVATFARRVTA